ncbi:MAG TPA: intradiol ring-cleavage dioxygenase [Methylomirabilota bacterium]|nr:intradiol ring-cleavage dioxygenase [Methylomirabilota bacterium]
MRHKDSHTRRQFLRVSAALPVFVIAVGSDVLAQRPGARPTPACGERTPTQTAGPYFKPNSPPRTSLLEPGMPGRRIVIEGSVLTTDCRPISRALVDFWQADDRGEYDNAGYRLRGHQFTDDGGRYRLETIVPGHYPGRTRHLHVKVQAPNGPVLTTQLYFPDEPANKRDGIFAPELMMKIRDADAGQLATFNFVLLSGARKT